MDLGIPKRLSIYPSIYLQLRHPMVSLEGFRWSCFFSEKRAPQNQMNFRRICTSFAESGDPGGPPRVPGAVSCKIFADSAKNLHIPRDPFFHKKTTADIYLSLYVIFFIIF